MGHLPNRNHISQLTKRTVCGSTQVSGGATTTPLLPHPTNRFRSTPNTLFATRIARTEPNGQHHRERKHNNHEERRTENPANTVQGRLHQRKPESLASGPTSHSSDVHGCGWPPSGTSVRVLPQSELRLPLAIVTFREAWVHRLFRADRSVKTIWPPTFSVPS